VRSAAGFALSMILAGTVLLAGSAAVRGQDMEPRAYSASPIGTNFLGAGYLRTTGSVSLDPSGPISNVEATINSGFLGYARTFALLGQTASAAILLPVIQGDVSGTVQQIGQKQVSRFGFGDLRLRVAENILGSPAMTPEEFARRAPSTTLGISLTVAAPTGDYNSAHLVNIGNNRWAFKPEIGLSQPIGNWFAELSGGYWIFTDNHNFFGGNVRGEKPIASAQLHFGYNFARDLWLAADGTYYGGGETVLNGVEGDDRQTVSRYGLTLSLPLRDGLSAKLSWASWLTGHNGGTFNTIGVAVQLRWFDD
jgi:hypothetical protein